jgi:hypothetical protein
VNEEVGGQTQKGLKQMMLWEIEENEVRCWMKFLDSMVKAR